MASCSMTITIQGYIQTRGTLSKLFNCHACTAPSSQLAAAGAAALFSATGTSSRSLISSAPATGSASTGRDMPYHATTQTPMMPARHENTRATIPRVVKLERWSVSRDHVSSSGNFATYPAGNGAGGSFWPSRFTKSLVLPAALPSVGTLAALQAARWSGGGGPCFWSSVGASMKVASRPETTCHSM